MQSTLMAPFQKTQSICTSGLSVSLCEDAMLWKSRTDICHASGYAQLWEQLREHSSLCGKISWQRLPRPLYHWTWTPSACPEILQNPSHRRHSCRIAPRGTRILFHPSRAMPLLTPAVTPALRFCHCCLCLEFGKPPNSSPLSGTAGASHLLKANRCSPFRGNHACPGCYRCCLRLVRVQIQKSSYAACPKEWRPRRECPSSQKFRVVAEFQNRQSHAQWYSVRPF
mmetsp:Transcript_29283/g.54880  ORF Transcript_29283/g.54880 Transcript_29283/m.54880 type:complete len:226 (-) Transcript_29283:439-1116(-)